MICCCDSFTRSPAGGYGDVPTEARIVAEAGLALFAAPVALGSAVSVAVRAPALVPLLLKIGDGLNGNSSASAGPRALYTGPDGRKAAEAAGNVVIQASEKALAAFKNGYPSVLGAECAAFAKGAAGNVQVFVGKAAQEGAPGAGEFFFKYELPEVLKNVDRGRARLEYEFVK